MVTDMVTDMATQKSLNIMVINTNSLSDLKNKSILITGGAGFIGSHLSEFFVKNGAKRVVVLDDLSTGFKKNIEHFLAEPNFEFIEGSIVDLETCLHACKDINVVLHHAALGSVPRSVENPMATNLVNVNGFVNMLYAAKECGVQKFIYASSSSVYGDDQTFPKIESKTGNLLSPYAVSKCTNEKYATVFSSLYGLKTIGFRYFNVFGERQNPIGAYAAVIPKFISALLKNEQATIYGTGNNTRDFTYVANVVNANVLAISKQEMTANSVMNIACGGTISVNDIYKNISSLLEKSDTDPIYVSERKGEIKDSFANIALAKETIGYEPIVDIHTGIKKTVSWYKDINKNL
jgi:UDP-N-acetylglucosamine 4-epimerase